VKLLLEKKISGVPVVNEENEVIGIVSETDLIYPEKSVHLPAFIPILDSIIFIESFKKLEKEIKKMAAYKVKDVMNEDVITVREDVDIEEIVNIFVDKRINRAPVVDENNRLLGIITRTDILKHIY
jgi:CBS domain-containing protein